MNAKTGLDWFGAMTLYAHNDPAIRQTKPCYEERIIILQAKTFDEALAAAKEEAIEYAEGLDAAVFLGFATVFKMFEPPGPRMEVYSSMRELDLSAEEFIEHYHADGSFRING